MSSNTQFQFYSSTNADENAKCLIVAKNLSISLNQLAVDANVFSKIVAPPALQANDKLFAGASAIIRFLLSTETSFASNASLIDDLLNYNDVTVTNLVNSLSGNAANNDAKSQLLESLAKLEALQANPAVSKILPVIFYSNLSKAFTLLGEEATKKFPVLSAATQQVAKDGKDAAATNDKGNKKAKKDKETKQAPAAPFVVPDIVKPVITDFDWESAGLVSSLHAIFNAAILAAFPQSKDLNLQEANITRCGNPQFGDFQCNNAMGLAKAFKTLEGYKGPLSPKDVGECIAKGIPENPIVDSVSVAPNGFINIKLSTNTMVNTISSIVNTGVKPPKFPQLKVLVDFSSPNIAKEMHVGHLRSTIIGDCISRLLEFVNFEVARVNHLGDWGTQFGMLITYLLEAFPNILTETPNISDLTAIYKASKKRFDEDEAFKEKSRLNVVNLQAGQKDCYEIWKLLCDISRQEFQKVYNLLDVTLEEYGESYYNSMIPGVIENLKSKGLVYDENGMLLTKLDHFTIPLILRKSDGGYGYDSTDMAALHYRLFNLQRDWVIYITDAGQAPHFHMVFDAGKAAGWFKECAESREVHSLDGKSKEPRVDHIGFGVVCGEDGKRFKTRSSETVRLIDLLNAARDRMKESLITRSEEGKLSNLENLDECAGQLGYGAVKYFDLKNHPSTNYVFNYDRMLDTKGDTAVYLMFAYARLASILRKAKDERNIDIQAFANQANSILVLDNPSERALAFELLQFGDMIKSVIDELLPNRLCDYLSELCVKFTDFVTKCHVLNAPEEKLMKSRLILCEATRQVMAKCFYLLGIKPLERI